MRNVAFVRSAVGALMVTFAMERYCMNVYITVPMGTRKFIKKLPKGMFVPLALQCGILFSRSKEEFNRKRYMARMETCPSNLGLSMGIHPMLPFEMGNR
jgi:hypothetical protein